MNLVLGDGQPVAQEEGEDRNDNAVKEEVSEETDCDSGENQGLTRPPGRCLLHCDLAERGIRRMERKLLKVFSAFGLWFSELGHDL